MGGSPRKFGKLLTEGVKRISILDDDKLLRDVHQELAEAIGKESGSAIEYWRKGRIPSRESDIEGLAREILDRSDVGQKWLKDFLESADYPELLCKFDDISQRERWRGPSRTELDTTWSSGHSIEQLAAFVVGPPILHPHQFFGRERELQRVFDLWSRFPLQNVAVIGPRRSGKTSLLHYLKNITVTSREELRPSQCTDWIPNQELYRWVLVDFQDGRNCNRERLLRHILSNLDLPVPRHCDLYGFMDVVSERLETPALVLMDEIGAALESVELNQRFWWSLRALGSQTGGNLGFLLTSSALPALLAQEAGKSSPFFNIFGHTITLGPLSDSEARELIASSPRAFETADVEWILAHSRRWPLLLQLLCNLRLVSLERGGANNSWRERIRIHVARSRHIILFELSRALYVVPVFGI